MNSVVAKVRMKNIETAFSHCPVDEGRTGCCAVPSGGKGTTASGNALDSNHVMSREPVRIPVLTGDNGRFISHVVVQRVVNKCFRVRKEVISKQCNPSLWLAVTHSLM